MAQSFDGRAFVADLAAGPMTPELGARGGQFGDEPAQAPIVGVPTDSGTEFRRRPAGVAVGAVVAENVARRSGEALVDDVAPVPAGGGCLPQDLGRRGVAGQYIQAPIVDRDGNEIVKAMQQAIEPRPDLGVWRGRLGRQLAREPEQVIALCRGEAERFGQRD